MQSGYTFVASEVNVLFLHDIAPLTSSVGDSCVHMLTLGSVCLHCSALAKTCQAMLSPAQLFSEYSFQELAEVRYLTLFHKILQS